MPNTKQIMQVSAKKVTVPPVLAVGPAVFELRSEITPNGGTHSRRFRARWTKGTYEGNAFLELRPLSKTATEIEVSVEAPKGPAGLRWMRPARNRLAAVFAQAFAYEIETRTVEQTDPFVVRRTSLERVRERSA